MSNIAPHIFENHLLCHVITGRGASGRLVELAAKNSWRRVFVVSDAGVSGAGLLERVIGPLEKAGLLAGTYAEVPTEPPVNVADEIAARIIAGQANAVVALGGGSVIDATKVAALVARHGQPARNFLGIGKAGGRGLPTILIPTTAGTGSEATFVAILTDPATGNKVGVVDPCLLADCAVVDPALTDALPPAVTAATGMDALVHALEAFIARIATPLAQGLALQAAKYIGRSLEVVCGDPNNETARDEMAIGSHLAGMAFANSSCCAVHGLALPLGGRTHIPHGVITGCFAGEMMRHNAPECTEKFAEFSAALGWGTLNASTFCSRLDKLSDVLGLQTMLRSTPFLAEIIPAMARDAVANRRLMDPNPRPVAQTDAERIYRTVLGVR